MSIQALADRLGPLDEMRSTPAARRFTLAVWRALRDTGEPLNQTSIRRIATDAELDAEDAATLVSRYAELDHNGALVGLSGLSIADHPHAIQFPARTVFSWCAWDPFFLVPVLGGSAIVDSADPHTGAPVRLTFEDGRVTQATPAGTVISLVIPAPPDPDSPVPTIEDLWSSF